MSGVQNIKVTADESGMRLDRWFKAHFPQVRHGELEKYLRKGQVRVSGGRVKASRRLETDEEIRIPPLPNNRTTSTVATPSKQAGVARASSPCSLCSSSPIFPFRPSAPSAAGVSTSLITISSHSLTQKPWNTNHTIRTIAIA